MNRRTESKSRILFFECFNWVMTTAAAWGALMLIELLFAPEELRPWGGVLRALPCLLSYPLGRMLRTVHPRIGISLGLALAVCLSSIPLTLMFRADLAWVMMLPLYPILTFAIFITPYINGSNLLQPRHFLIGVIVFLADVLFIRIRGIDSYSTALNIVSVIFLCAGLFVYNRESLRSETSPDGKRAKFPKGSRRAGTLLVILFIGIALALANIGLLRKFFTELAISIAAGVIMLIDLIGRVMGISEPTQQGGSAAPSGDMMGLDGEYTTESGLVQNIWHVVLIIILIGICVAAVWLLIRLMKNFSGRFSGLWRRLFGIKPEENAYVDETEDLGGDQKLGDAILDGLKRMGDRLKRPARFDDMPTNREKVRLTYRRTLHRLSTKNRNSLYRTPNELEPEVERITGPAAEEFVDIYNRARYSTEDISDSEAEVARGVYKQV